MPHLTLSNPNRLARDRRSSCPPFRRDWEEVAHAASPAKTAAPLRVFIGGCERSGTTFLAAEIARWSGLTLLPESHHLAGALRACASDERLDPYGALSSSWRFRTWGLSRQTVAHLRSARGASGASPAQAFDDLAQGYHARWSGGAPFIGWIEHAPHSLQNLQLLRATFPDAKFVHVVRDGRAVAASILPLDFGPNRIQEAAIWWQASVTPGLAAAAAYPATVLSVRYEDLVARGAAVRQKVLAHLGCSEGAAPGLARIDPYWESTHSRVHEGANPDRIDAWRKRLTAREVEDFEALAGGTLAALGYRLEFRGAARERRAAHYAARLQDAVEQIVWNLPRRTLRRYRADWVRWRRTRAEAL